MDAESVIPVAATAAQPAEAAAIRAMAGALVSAGKLGQAEADAMVAVDLSGGHMEAMSPVLADPLQNVALDPVLDRPEAPAGYTFPRAQSADMAPAEVQEWQALAWQARMPAPIASEIFSIADGHAASPMQSADVELMGARTLAQLHSRYGEQGTQEKLALGRRLVSELAAVDPRVKSLVNGPVGCDPRFIFHIVEHAARLYGGSK